MRPEKRTAALSFRKPWSKEDAMDMRSMSALEIGAAIREKKITVREVTECYLSAIESTDGD